MSRRKQSPEQQIITLFTGLSEEGKRMVMFGLEAIASVESPKSSASVAAPRSSPKRAATKSTPSADVEAESASDVPVFCVAQVPGLNVECGNVASNGIHDPKGGYGGYHEFVAPKSKKAAAQK